MSLIELTKKRRAHVKSCRENDDAAHKIIADMYSSRTHFIYEIIQNADDAGAKNISFILSQDNLKIEHDGKRQFHYRDVEAITTLGSSTKPDKINTIGRFGAGFKSVFTVTKSPHIHSGEFHFRIVDLIVPETIEPIDCGNKTIIELPFNNDTQSKPEVYQQVLSSLEKLSTESLLFLNNIKQINWTTDRKSGFYHCSEVQHGKKATVVKRINDLEEVIQYLVYERRVLIQNKSLKLIIAYHIKDKKFQRLAKPIHVFFPTEVKPGFNFVIHVPYKTTPNRETIDFYDSENITLSKELSLLIQDSILEIKKAGLIDVDFLNILPICSPKDEDDSLYENIFKDVRQLFFKESLIPTTESQLCNSQDAVFAQPHQDLVDLLDQHDLQNLFGKHFFVTSKITDKKKTWELYFYLSSKIKIETIGREKLYNKISEDFLVTKSDDWLMKFYEFASRHKYKALYERPIIRLENGSHTIPSKAYLPSGQKTKFNTIKTSLVCEENTDFFKYYLEMKEPDEVDEIKEFISCKYHQNSPEVTKNQYLKDFNDAYSIWKNSKEKKDKIIEELNKVAFVGCINKDRQFCIKQHKPSSANYDYQGNPWRDETSQIIYFNDDTLKIWFEGNIEDNYFFLTPELTDKKYKDFLMALGVQKTLFFDYNFCFLTKWSSGQKKYRKGNDNFNPNLNIHGFNFVIGNINLRQSLMLWETLLGFEKFEIFKGRIDFRKNKTEDWQKGEEKLSKLMELISNNYWLYDKDGNLIERSLSEIRVDLLHDDYDHSHKNSVKLFEALGLIHDTKQQELAAQVEEEIKRRKEAEIRAEEAEKREKEKDAEIKRLNQQIKKHEIPLNDSNNNQVYSSSEVANIDDDFNYFTDASATLVIDDRPLKVQPPEDLSNQPSSRSNSRFDTTRHHNSSTLQEQRKASHLNPALANETGKEGERRAEKYLRDKYGDEIINWNDEGSGKGYDFIRKVNGKEIAYYEVKTRQDRSKKSIEISKSQWDCAKREGEKYIILVVTLETNQVREFRNPFKLWKDDMLKAQALELSWKDEE